MKRKLALTLALLQLLSFKALKLDENSPSFLDGITVKACAASKVLIFDNDNIKTRQYGGNQRVFNELHSDELLSNPYILEEMQTHFPVESFEFENEAMEFYKLYLKLLRNNGCGYVAAADYTFRLFEGKEDEFEKTFGYPMYTYKDGKIDFNYEVFIIKFFNFSLLDMKDMGEEIKNAIIKDVYDTTLYEYTTSEEYRRKRPDNFDEWSDEEWDEWEAFEETRRKHWKYLFDRYMNAKNRDLDLGIPVDASFGYFYTYLGLHGISLNAYCEFKADDEYEPDTIIASENFTLYGIDESGEKTETLENVGAHYVYITDITEDGKIIVSSWGRKYIFDNSGALWTSSIKFTKNN